MKKSISIFLAIVMIFMMSMPTFAVDISTRQSTDVEYIETAAEEGERKSIFDSICDFFDQIFDYIMNIIFPQEEPEQPIEQSDGKYYYIYFLTGEYASNFPIVVDQVRIMSGEPIEVEVPIPERTGYKFVGWEPAELPPIMPDQDLRCVAQWEKLDGYSSIYIDVPEDTLILDITWGRKEIRQKIGTEVQLPKNLIRENYAFVGWEPEFPKTMPEEDITITAIWRKKTDVTITWKIRTQDGWEEVYQYYDSGDVLYQPVITMGPAYWEKEKAYYFEGWSPEVSSIVTEDATYVAQYTLRE